MKVWSRYAYFLSWPCPSAELLKRPCWRTSFPTRISCSQELQGSLELLCSLYEVSYQPTLFLTTVEQNVEAGKLYQSWKKQSNDDLFYSMGYNSFEM